jgi:hypothetical protein
MSKTPDSPYSGFSKRPYSPLWWIVGIASMIFTVDPISHIMEKAEVRHGIAFSIALVVGAGLAFAMAMLERIEKRGHRIAIVVAMSICFAGVWYWSR